MSESPLQPKMERKLYFIKLSFHDQDDKKLKKLISTGDLSKIVNQHDFEKILRRAFHIDGDVPLLIERKSRKHQAFVPLASVKDYDSLKRSLSIKDTVKVSLRLLDSTQQQAHEEQAPETQPSPVIGELKRLEISKLILKFEELINFNNSNIQESIRGSNTEFNTNTTQEPPKLNFEQLFNIDKFANDLLADFASKIDDLSELITNKINEKLNIEEILARFQVSSIPDVKEEPKSDVVHYNVYCDGSCSSESDHPINGIRYKCSICEDFDLCEKCENYENNVHKLDHPLIKIKLPLSKEMKLRLLNRNQPRIPDIQSFISRAGISSGDMFLSLGGLTAENIDQVVGCSVEDLKAKAKKLDDLISFFKEFIPVGRSLEDDEIINFFKLYVTEYGSEFTRPVVSPGQQQSESEVPQSDTIEIELVPRGDKLISMTMKNGLAREIPKNSTIMMLFRNESTLDINTGSHPCAPSSSKTLNLNLSDYKDVSMQDFTSNLNLLEIVIFNNSSKFYVESAFTSDLKYSLKEDDYNQSINKAEDFVRSKGFEVDSKEIDVLLHKTPTPSAASTVILPKLSVSSLNNLAKEPVLSEEQSEATDSLELSPEPEFVSVTEDGDISMTEAEETFDDDDSSYNEGYEVLSTSGYGSDF